MRKTNSELKPKQARAVQTEKALLDALEKLLEREPFADITVSALAQEAGLTTGAIYRRFSDKNDVLRRAFQRFHDRTNLNLQNNRERFPQSLPDRDVLHRFLFDLMMFTLDNVNLMRAANGLNDQRSFQLMVDARNTSSDWLAERLTSSRLENNERSNACRFVLRIATATFRDTFLTGHRTALNSLEYAEAQKSELERLCSNLSDMAAFYLKIEESN